MNRAASSCSDDSLHVLLQGEPHSDDFRSAAEHLESCTVCQSRLAELAADENEWIDATGFLKMDETDRQIEREQVDRSWSSPAHHRGPSHWTDSMIRNLIAPPSHPEMLGRLGRYEIESHIGAGGMGVVFKGFDSELNRPVAIKVLAPHLSGNGAARQRFAREARAAAAIVHEHVVAIHDVQSEHDPPFLVMQYVAGPSLQGRIDDEGPLDLCQLLRIAHQAAAGLAAAHQQGLVHRDIKPSNILLEQGVERALLGDFGLARASDDASLTYSGHALGTPLYMSPEQARGETIDQRSDLFSLGSVMYCMCTGRPPFRAESSFGILRRITDTAPRPIREVNPKVPHWLGCFIARLHAKSPDERYQSAAEVADLLAQCLAHVQQPEGQPLPDEVTRDARRANPRSAWRQRRWLVAGVAAMAVAGFLGLLVSFQAVGNRPGPAVDTQPPDATAGSPEDSASGVSATNEFEAATDWDAAEDELRQLTEQVGQFTRRASRPWDNLPKTKPTEVDTIPPATIDPLDQEPM